VRHLYLQLGDTLAQQFFVGHGVPRRAGFNTNNSVDAAASPAAHRWARAVRRQDRAVLPAQQEPMAALALASPPVPKAERWRSAQPLA
jgi:hypothetical protein